MSLASKILIELILSQAFVHFNKLNKWPGDSGLTSQCRQRHWKTEIVAAHVEMLSGRRKKDYEAQQAAEALVAQAEAYGEAPPSEPIPIDASGLPGDDGDAEAEDEAAA